MNRAAASSPAPTRPPTRALLRAAWLAVLAAPACSLSQEGVQPPTDTFFYPTSAVMNPSDAAGQWLYVANSNADLRFNDGTLVMANVGDDVTTAAGAVIHGAAADRTKAWSTCPQEDYVNPLPRSDAPICCIDQLDTNILNCDERRYVNSPGSVRIGSFAAGTIWQRYCDDPCAKQACNYGENEGRILIGVRGDTSLTVVDVDPPGVRSAATTTSPAFHCTNNLHPDVNLAECDRKVVDTAPYLTTEIGDNSISAVSLPDEPYALNYDPLSGYLYVGHLVGSTANLDTGGVSLFDASQTALLDPTTYPPLPSFIAPFPSPFVANTSGFYGVSAITLHPSLEGGANELFVSSRYVPLVATMVPIGPSVCNDDDNDDVLVDGSDSLNPGLVGSEMRGVVFDDASQQVFALERIPPDLVTFNIATDVAGATTALPASVIEMCSSPTFLYQFDAGDGNHLYINCFDTGEVYIVDPSVPSLLTTLTVGRGPGGLTFDVAHKVAYVIDFTQNDLSVIDLAPGSPTQFHVIQRLGFPSLTPR